MVPEIFPAQTMSTTTTNNAATFQTKGHELFFPVLSNYFTRFHL